MKRSLIWLAEWFAWLWDSRIPMKNRLAHAIIIAFCLGVVLSPFTSNPPNSVLAIESNLITTSSGASYWLGPSNTAQLFYANDRYWVVYMSYGGSETWVIKSSTDGSSWSSITSLEFQGHPTYCDFYCNTSDNTLHYVRSYYAMENTALYYRKATLAADGTFTWAAAEQTAVAAAVGITYKYPQIVADSSDRPWIAYAEDGSTDTIRLTWTANVDGTWATEEDIQVSTDGSSKQKIGVSMAIASDDLVSVIWKHDFYYLRSRTHDGFGGSLGTEKAVGTYPYSDVNAAAIMDDDSVMLVFKTKPSDDCACSVMIYDPDTDSWGSATDLGSIGAGPYQYFIGVSQLVGGNAMIVTSLVFNSTGNDVAAFKAWNGSSWDTSWTTLYTEAYSFGRGIAIAEGTSGDHFGWVYRSSSSPYPMSFWKAESPEATTGAATTGITKAQLNGICDSVGDWPDSDNIQFRFNYGTTVAYGSNTTWQTDLEATDVFDEWITGLTEGTTYHCRTEATSPFGTDYGSDIEFTTGTMYAPTNLTAVPTGGTTMDVSWYPGGGGDGTILRYSTAGYPSYSGGTLAYSGLATGAALSDLTPGTTYYLAAWSVEEGEDESDPAYAIATTPASAEGVDLTPSTDPNASGPDDSTLSDLPGKDMSDWIATQLGLDSALFIQIVALAVIGIFSIGVAVISESIMVTMAVTLLASGIAIYIGLMPWWAIFVYGLVAGGISYIKGGQSYA